MPWIEMAAESKSGTASRIALVYGEEDSLERGYISMIKKRWISWMVAGGAMLATLAASGSAFAKTNQSGPQGGIPLGSSPTLSIDYVSSPTPTTVSVLGSKTLANQYTVKVSGLTVPHHGSALVVFNYDVVKPYGVGVPLTPIAVKKAGSEVFTVIIPVILDNEPLNLDAFENYGPLSVAGPSNTVSLSGKLPYGQLPEVPWAAGLPLLAGGVGVGGLLWRRRGRVI